MSDKAQALETPGEPLRCIWLFNFRVADMYKDPIKVPEKGTYKWQLFKQWSDEFRQTHADHVAYIALHLAGVLEPCRAKLDAMIQHHRQHACDAAGGARHSRAIARLQNTMTGAAMAYETSFRHH